MSRFKVGDRAIVTGDTVGWESGFKPNTIVLIVSDDRGPGSEGGNYPAGTSGYRCRFLSGLRPVLEMDEWDVAEVDLRSADSEPAS